MTYSNNTDFNTYITIIHNKWSSAKALGTNISDENFKNIISNLLPSLWDSAVATFYDVSISSLETISCLQICNIRINRGCSAVIPDSYLDDISNIFYHNNHNN